MNFDTSMTDELLATTRAVRKRLDLTKPVPRDLINECLELAVQAPTGSNSQTWRWLVVDEGEKRRALAELYRELSAGLPAARAEFAKDPQTSRVYDSAEWLGENLHRVPVLVIPCIDQQPWGIDTRATAAAVCSPAPPGGSSTTPSSKDCEPGSGNSRPASHRSGPRRPVSAPACRSRTRSSSNRPTSSCPCRACPRRIPGRPPWSC